MDYVILFTSYYFADKTDHVLTDIGLAHHMMATPPALSDCCGLCVRLSEDVLGLALRTLRVAHISHSGVYVYHNKNDVEKLSSADCDNIEKGQV